MAKMVGKSCILADIGVRRPSRAILAVYRLLRSHFWSLYTCGGVMILVPRKFVAMKCPGSGMDVLRWTKGVTFFELCGKRRSFLIVRRLQSDEATLLFWQWAESGKSVIFSNMLSLFAVLEPDKGVKEINGEVPHLTKDEKSILEAYGLKKLLSGATCTSTCATRLVALKA